MKQNSKFWFGTLFAAVVASLVVSGLYAANNININYCTWDTTGSGGPASPCVTPTDAQGTAVVGGTAFHFLTAATNNATLIKASAGELLSWRIENTQGTGLVSVRFYNTATTPSAGVPCNSATNLLSNDVVQNNTVSPGLAVTLPSGMRFSTGLVICVTGANADNDNTNATTGLNVNGLYN